MKFYLIGLLILISACSIGCYQKPVITKDYVINPNWSENANEFTIIRMKFKNEKDSINPNNAPQYELTNKLIRDSNFSYTANVKYNGESYSKRKIYFNKDNGFVWWNNNNDSDKTVLGDLERNTWYLLAGLSQFRTWYYVYIDTQGNIYYSPVNTSNF